MNARIYFILGLTFITGMFAGAYLYVTSFAPDYQKSDIEELSEIEFKLQGQMTGGCLRGGGVCPSFVLNHNRMYEYIPQYRLQEGEPGKVVGKMNSETFKIILKQVQDTDIEALQKTNARSCQSYLDGIDYNYHLTYAGEIYEFNTCGTNFANSTLDNAFRPLWEQLATSSDVKANQFEGGIGGYLQDQLDKKFDYDE